MREVCHSSAARPRDNRRQEDTNEEGAFDAKHHEKDSEESASPGTLARAMGIKEDLVSYPPVKMPNQTVGFRRTLVSQ